MENQSKKFSIIGNFLGMAFCLLNSLQELFNGKTPIMFMIATFLFFAAAVMNMSTEALKKSNKV